MPKFHIRTVALWPRKQGLKRRDIAFSSTSVNIVSGQSKAGKSALLWIIDYCLLSSNCNIPIGCIRESCLWFGIHFIIDETELILCRTSPSAEGRSQVFYQEGNDLLLPDEAPTKNTGLVPAKQRLDNILNLPHIGVESGKDRPSFRDTLAFCLQPQHITANPYTLFYRTDRMEYQAKLRNLLPLVLGVESPETIESRLALEHVNKKIVTVEKAWSASLSANTLTVGELQGHTRKAHSLGLLSDIELDEIRGADDSQPYVIALKHAASRSQSATGLENLSRADLESEIQQYDKLDRQARKVRSRLSRIERTRSSADEYTAELQALLKRTEPVGWFVRRLAHAHDCPLCGSQDTMAPDHLERITGAMIGANSKIAQNSSTRPFDRESSSLHEELSGIESKLLAIRTKISRMHSWQQEKNRLMEVFRFAGFLDHYVKSIAFGDEELLTQQRKDLRREQTRLKRILARSNTENLRKHALVRISDGLRRYAKALELERSDEPIWFDPKELTVRFGQIDSYDSKMLWQIGSGSNYMGYHVSTLLSLQRDFMQAQQTVPSFLVIDQPSQVYFPEDWPDDLDTLTEDQLDSLRNEGHALIKVRDLLSVISNFHSELDSHVQIIILDHLGPSAWSKISNINLVANWRGEERLIPKEWYTDEG